VAQALAKIASTFWDDTCIIPQPDARLHARAIFIMSPPLMPSQILAIPVRTALMASIKYAKDPRQDPGSPIAATLTIRLSLSWLRRFCYRLATCSAVDLFVRWRFLLSASLCGTSLACRGRVDGICVHISLILNRVSASRKITCRLRRGRVELS
jgi:hypothetical protein